MTPRMNVAPGTRLVAATAARLGDALVRCVIHAGRDLEGGMSSLVRSLAPYT
jgi:hypothetical protein